MTSRVERALDERRALARRAYLGLELEPAEGGLLVVDVASGAAADISGVRTGDVLLAVDGVAVDRVLQAYAVIGALRVGTVTRLTLRRGEEVVLREALASEMPLEPLSSGRVVLDQVEWGAHLLRAVWTFPEGPGPFPGVWLLPGATWIAEEQPLLSWYPTFRLVDELTQAGFATLRVERSGLGDSEGPPCTELDLESELDAFRAARRHFLARRELLPERRFLYGRSLGGMLAPLLARGEPFAAVAVWGTSPGPWHRAMLEASRAQYQLAGYSRELVECTLSRLRELQELVYVRGLAPSEVYARRPDLADVQPQTFDRTHVYGRSHRYFHQLTHAPIAEAWSEVTCPVLALRGTSDFSSSAIEHERIARLAPNVTVAEVPGLDHHMHERGSSLEALREPWGGTFHPSAARLLAEFFAHVGAARNGAGPRLETP